MNCWMHDLCSLNTVDLCHILCYKTNRKCYDLVETIVSSTSLPFVCSFRLNVHKCLVGYARIRNVPLFLGGKSLAVNTPELSTGVLVGPDGAYTHLLTHLRCACGARRGLHLLGYTLEGSVWRGCVATYAMTLRHSSLTGLCSHVGVNPSLLVSVIAQWTCAIM